MILNKDIEGLLKEVSKFKECGLHYCLDIYYNDLDETFVVKIHGYDTKLKGKRYFRNKQLIDSLLDAYVFLQDRANLI